MGIFVSDVRYDDLPCTRTKIRNSMELLLQLRVLRLCLLQDRNLGVGVSPEREEILIGCPGFGCVTLHCASAGHAEMRQHAECVANRDSAAIHNFLKFSRGFGAAMQSQVCLAAQ